MNEKLENQLLRRLIFLLYERKVYMDIRIFWDMDGVLAMWQEIASLSALYENGHFANLPADRRLCEYAEELSKKGIETYLLTQYLHGSTTYIPEKETWTKREMPGMEEKILFVPSDTRKSDFVEDWFKKDLTKNDILVDDHSPNLIPWELAGGTAIKWCNGFNDSRRSKFSGMRAHSVEELKKFISSI